MQITKNTVVTLNYKVHDAKGNVVDDGSEPLVYLHGGYDDIFRAIEEGLHEKDIGAKLEVKLEPEDAFGPYDAELVNIEARDMFPPEIQIGMHVEREDETMVTITDIQGDTVVVDGNHPLAGIALIFSCSVADVRSATADEVTHKHAHGAHGHHH
jgi:FKBP-type peptidyl-prolyl cis-trans isomerase SlyD